MKMTLLLITLFCTTCIACRRERQPVRHEEKAEAFTINVLESTISITRNEDNTSLEIANILWGEDPALRVLPAKMLNKADSTLLVPMSDFSYWLIDLNALFANQGDRSAFLLAKFEGGGRKGRRFSRSRLFWALDRNLETGIIQGSIMDDKDKGGWFFLDLERNLAFVNDESLQSMLVLRSVSEDNEEETTFEIVVDSDVYSRFLKASSNQQTPANE